MTEEIEEIELPDMNEQLILVCGESGTGKTASLMNIKDQENWLYLNCEAGKRLPFKNKFQTAKITDPLQIFEAFEYAADPENGIKGIIIDTITFLMDMFESVYVRNAANTQKAWGDYADYFRRLMQQHIAAAEFPVLVLGHTKSDLDENTATMKTAVPIKGSLRGNGVEAFFSLVVATKKVPIKELDKFSNPRLNISEEDRELGFKHVFQTRLTKGTVGERIRAPLGMFNKEETYIDNDAASLLEHLKEFYS